MSVEARTLADPVRTSSACLVVCISLISRLLELHTSEIVFSFLRMLLSRSYSKITLSSGRSPGEAESSYLFSSASTSGSLIKNEDTLSRSI